MADTFEELTLPATESYRVVGLGARYLKAAKRIGGDGKPTVQYVDALATGREVVELIEPEAERLLALGAVRPIDSAKGYDEMDDAELRSLASGRGIAVRSSGADPEQPLRTDYMNALAMYDLGADSAVVAAGTTPGGVFTAGDRGVSPVLVDGINPAVSTAQPDHVDTTGLVEGNARSAQAGGVQAEFGAYDARGKSATDLSAWISSAKPNASATVAAAHDDPDAAAALIEAEEASHGGDGRATVIDPLTKIADGSGGQ